MKKFTKIMLFSALSLTLLCSSSCITAIAMGAANRKAAQSAAIENAKPIGDYRVNVQRLLTNENYCNMAGCTRGIDYITAFRVTLLSDKKKLDNLDCTLTLKVDSPYIEDELARTFKYRFIVNPEKIKTKKNYDMYDAINDKPIHFDELNIYQAELNVDKTPYYRRIYQNMNDPAILAIDCQ